MRTSLGPPPKNRTAEDHIAVIKRWQAETGKTGAPPRAYDVKTSNYILWCRSAPDSPAAIAFEAAVAPLGISLGKGPISVHRTGKVNLSQPRGVLQCMEAARACFADGRTPSMLAPSVGERHLAGWCVRAQAGIVSGRHIPFNPMAPTSVLMADFVHELNELQPAREFAVQWHAFTQRLVTQFERATKGAGWCEYLCERKDAYPNEAAFLREAEQLRRRTGQRPALPHPLAVIGAINRILGALPQPVTFTDARPTTVDAAHRLLGEGIELHHDFPGDH